jgi:NADH-quinone oxidoreductase subunit G
MSVKLGSRGPLPFDGLRELPRHMCEKYPVLADTDLVTCARWEPFGEAGAVAADPVPYLIDDFYQTDPVGRASRTMARCSEFLVERRHPAPARTGAHG